MDTRPLPRLVLLALSVVVSAICADATEACGNPHDWVPDDRALQDCLDEGGTIRLEPGLPGYNVLIDNTDIDLVSGGGTGCVVELNVIAHFVKYAFAGLNIGGFDGDGDHTDSEFRGNTVYSAVPDKLAMGILVGSHPWTTDPGAIVVHAGEITGNTSYGNVFNLVVEGVRGGVVQGNVLHSPGGTDSNCGRPGANYIVNPNHVSDMTLQKGWTAFKFDEWRCGPLPVPARPLTAATEP